MKLEHFSTEILTNFSIINLVEAEIEFGLKCERIAFPCSAFNKYHAFQFSHSNSSGKVVYGLGVDINEKKAIIKGFVEFHERNAFFNVGLKKGFSSTNGIAGHRFYSLAEQSAISEIKERDSFLMHWYSKTPFAKVKASKDFENHKSSLAVEGYELLFLETTLGYARTTICFLIDRTSLGFVIGLSSGKTEIEDMQKAFSEALINLYFGGYGKSSEEQKMDLKNKGLNNLTNHRCYWLYSNTIPSWILESTSQAGSLHSSNRLETTKLFHIKHKLIHIVGVMASKALPLEVGYPSEESVSLLNRRLETKFKVEEVEPHPLP